MVDSFNLSFSVEDKQIIWQISFQEQYYLDCYDFQITTDGLIDRKELKLFLSHEIYQLPIKSQSDPHLTITFYWDGWFKWFDAKDRGNLKLGFTYVIETYKFPRSLSNLQTKSTLDVFSELLPYLEKCDKIT